MANVDDMFAPVPITKRTTTTTYTYTQLNRKNNDKGALSKLKNKFSRKKPAKRTVTKTSQKFEKATPIHISKQNRPVQNNCTSPRLPQSYTNPTSPKSPPLHYNNHRMSYNTHNPNNHNPINNGRRSAGSVQLQQQYTNPNRFVCRNSSPTAVHTNQSNNYQRNSQNTFRQRQQSEHIPTKHYYKSNNKSVNNYSNNQFRPVNTQNNSHRHQSQSNMHSKPLRKKVHKKDRTHSRQYNRALPNHQNDISNNLQNINNICIHDALLWNSYIDAYKMEPNTTETFCAFLKQTKQININYEKAKNIFRNYKGKGRINVNKNNKSLKIKQIKLAKKTDNGNGNGSYSNIHKSMESKANLKVKKSKSLPIDPVMDPSVNPVIEHVSNVIKDDNELKIWIEKNYFSHSLYVTLLGKLITFETLQFIDMNDLDPLCDELCLGISEKVRLKAAIKKLQHNSEQKEVVSEVKNEGIGLGKDEFIIEDESEAQTAGAFGENEENIEGDSVNNENIMAFTNGFIEYENSEMYNEENIGSVEVGSLVSEGVFYEMDNMGVNEVKDWLEAIDMSMYYDLLLKHGFDSMKMVKLIQTAKDLEDVGIKMKAHQLKIITAIQSL